MLFCNSCKVDFHSNYETIVHPLQLLVWAVLGELALIYVKLLLSNEGATVMCHVTFTGCFVVVSLYTVLLQATRLDHSLAYVLNIMNALTYMFSGILTLIFWLLCSGWEMTHYRYQQIFENGKSNANNYGVFMAVVDIYIFMVCGWLAIY